MPTLLPNKTSAPSTRCTPESPIIIVDAWLRPPLVTGQQERTLGILVEKGPKKKKGDNARIASDHHGALVSSLALLSAPSGKCLVLRPAAELVVGVSRSPRHVSKRSTMSTHNRHLNDTAVASTHFARDLTCRFWLFEHILFSL